MKIYHTETQADYDALMIELEEQGCEWSFGRKLTGVDNWYIKKHLTCIRVYDLKVYQASLNYYKEEYPNIPIIKYKAKADEKMRFTKENVEKVIDEYFRQADFEPCGDLIAEIHNLDDTRKKVPVPKCFDEWYQEIKGYALSDSSAKQFALWKLCRQGFGHGYEDVHDKKIPYETDLGKWLLKNKMLAIDAVLYGYTTEPEQLYYIPLPHLETSDGIQQVLSKRKGDKHYFASRPASALQQRYTKEELEQVPEVYKPFAKLIEEDAND